MIPEIRMPRALLSVSDKTGLIDFARGLAERGWTLLSTGGTAAALRAASVPVTEVSEVTGHPEIMDGRVKTLHPAIHGGLLARGKHPGDTEQMAALGYEKIDLVAVNLYPFQQTVARAGVTDAEAIEQIDIGGPSMLRSAAKNHERVWVVVDPADYPRVLSSLDEDGDGAGGGGLRRELAIKVFQRTSEYDAAIQAYLSGGQVGEAGKAGETSSFPERLDLELRLEQPLRYGENPDQRAAFYREVSAGPAAFRQLHGKELSFNNLLDVDAALLAVAPWASGDLAACAIVKHTTPCGLAVAESPEAAYRKALATDPTSAFGSVVAFNRAVSAACAEQLRPNFVEAVAAPAFDDAAIAILTEKKNIRLLVVPAVTADPGFDFKRVRGGFLVQDRLDLDFEDGQWTVVTRRAPSQAEWDDLRFAWRAVATVKSNAILIARDGATLGIGAGQMSRVDSSRIAVLKAADQGHSLAGSSLASDAFFPFRDGVDAAAGAGVSAIVQPGGSVRDEEVIAAADEHGLAMVFTGRRLFRH